jgi:hypothetical protein
MKMTDPSLNFECPVCGAAPHERCETNSGTPRFESHRERRDVAKDVDTLERELIEPCL